MKRQKSPTLRGSVRQSTVRVREDPSFWSSFMVRVTLLAATLVALIIGLFVLWHNGWPQRAVGRVANASLELTKNAQFAVKDIIVEGRQQTSKDAISAALGTGAGDPILSFEPKEAQARLAKLPWIATATVERRLPDTIVVHLTERVPMARWQHDNHTVVIDLAGEPLADARLEQFSDLPLVVGADAPIDTKNLLDSLNRHPVVQHLTTASVRVSGRRWDLHLQPDVVVRLPETDIDDALDRLSSLITEKNVLSRNLAAIDLRLSDRVTFEPIPPPVKTPSGPAKK